MTHRVGNKTKKRYELMGWGRDKKGVGVQAIRVRGSEEQHGLGCEVGMRQASLRTRSRPCGCRGWAGVGRLEPAGLCAIRT